MVPWFWAAGLPWRMTMAAAMPVTWHFMYQAARMRHRMVFGHWGHDPFVRAFYYGRGR